MLHVSASTLQGRRKEFGLSDNFESYSDITDDELDEIYVGITGNSSKGPLSPNVGRRRFIGALRSRGLRIPRCRVSDCLCRVGPVGTALRWRMTVHRRKYYVPTPSLCAFPGVLKHSHGVYLLFFAMRKRVNASVPAGP